MTRASFTFASTMRGRVSSGASSCTRVMPDRALPDDVARPRHLDPTALATPSLALANAVRETLRVGDLIEAMLGHLLPVLEHNQPAASKELRLLNDDVASLCRAVKLYLAQIPREAMSEHESRRWAEVLEDLSIDPMRCADRLDWPAKLRLLEGYRNRDGLGWGDSRLKLVDLQYSDVRPDKGLYNRLVARGSMQRLLTEEEIERAVVHAPTDTRAYFRGECLRRFPAQVAAASWDSVVFDLGGENLVRIPTMEPLRGTREHVGALFEASATARDLVDTITGR